MFRFDGYRLNTLSNQEKETLHNLLVSSQQEALAQRVDSLNQVNHDDVPVSHLLNTYKLRLECLGPMSRSKRELEFLIDNMSAFNGPSVRLNIISNTNFQALVFTDKNYHKVLGCLSNGS